MKGKRQVISLLNPAQLPALTLRSARDFSALTESECTTLNNWRFDGRAATVRAGIALDKGATGLPASYEFRGGLIHHLGQWVAVLDLSTSKVRVYQWDDGGSTWSEISDGTTRFDEGNYVEFQIVTEPVIPGIDDFDDPNNNYIIWQNGVELPRIRNASPGGSYSSRLHQRFANPLPEMSKAQSVPLAYYNTQGSLTLTSSGGGLTFTEPAVTTGGKKILLTATTSSASGHHATVQFASGITFTETPRQIQIVYDSADSFIWAKLRLAIFDGTTQYILYDPTENPEALTLQAIDDKYAVALIDIDAVYDTGLTLVSTGLPTGINFNRIRLQWVDSAPAATTTISLYSITFGGGVRWGVQAGVAYFGHLSRAESRGVVCATVPNPLLKDVGGTPIPSTRLIASTAARYNLRITTHKYGTLSANATRVVPYLLTAAGYEFLQAAVAPYDMSSSSTREVLEILLKNEDTVSRAMPSEFHESVPIGLCMTHTGSRLVVGNARTADASVTSGNGQVWLSAHEYPFRFSKVVNVYSNGEINPQSPVAVTVGDDEVVAVRSVTNAYTGSDPVAVFTGSRVHRLEGSDASSLSRPFLASTNGTRSPRSIVSYGRSMLYLDTNRQVRFLHEMDNAPSRTFVDDKLKGIPDERIPHVSAARFRDRYYLAITPLADTANTQILIFDPRTGGWFSDSTSSTARFQRLFSVVENEKQKLFFFSTNGGIYEHENGSATLDIGTDITAIMRFREIQAENFLHEVVVGRVGVMCDKVANEQVTIRRYLRRSNSGPVNSIIDIGADRSTGETDDLQVARWDRSASSAATEVAASDIGVSVQLEVAVPSGFTLKNVFAEVEVYDGKSGIDIA
jgi:hypothetical protein